MQPGRAQVPSPSGSLASAAHRSHCEPAYAPKHAQVGVLATPRKHLPWPEHRPAVQTEVQLQADNSVPWALECRVAAVRTPSRRTKQAK